MTNPNPTTDLDDEVASAAFALKCVREDRERGFGLYARIGDGTYATALCKAQWRLETALAAAGHGCHCGDVSQHPVEAPDICPTYESYVADEGSR